MLKEQYKQFNLALIVVENKIKARIRTNLEPIEIIGIYELLKNEPESKRKVQAMAVKVLFDKLGRPIKKQVSKKGEMPIEVIYEKLKKDFIDKMKVNKFKFWRQDGREEI